MIIINHALILDCKQSEGRQQPGPLDPSRLRCSVGGAAWHEVALPPRGTAEHRRQRREGSLRPCGTPLLTRTKKLLPFPPQPQLELSVATWLQWMVCRNERKWVSLGTFDRNQMSIFVGLGFSFVKEKKAHIVEFSIFLQWKSPTF